VTGKDIIKITLNFVIIYVIGGLVLAGIYAKTSPIIYKNNERAKQEALKKLIPEADSIIKIGDWVIHEKAAEYYEAKKGSETLGYIVQSFGKGYSSYINTLIATDKDIKIKKINVLSHGETPGLGDEIEFDSFTDMFKGKTKEQMKVLKTETTEYIQALSGATISTRAVAEDAVKNGLLFLTEKYKGGGDGSLPR
jgi:electron transport complex protein RnfG